MLTEGWTQAWVLLGGCGAHRAGLRKPSVLVGKGLHLHYACTWQINLWSLHFPQTVTCDWGVQGESPARSDQYRSPLHRFYTEETVSTQFHEVIRNATRGDQAVVNLGASWVLGNSLMALRGNERRPTCGYRHMERERESPMWADTQKKHLRLYKQSESFGIFENFSQMGLNF